jgi:hypothetical protein
VFRRLQGPGDSLTMCLRCLDRETAHNTRTEATTTRLPSDAVARKLMMDSTIRVDQRAPVDAMRSPRPSAGKFKICLSFVVGLSLTSSTKALFRILQANIFIKREHRGAPYF